MNIKLYDLPEKPHCVLADGPYEIDGDGGYEYVVCFGSDEGDPIEAKKAMWRISSFDEAYRFGEELAAKYDLEFLPELMPA